jgi:hypothetical protein
MQPLLLKFTYESNTCSCPITNAQPMQLAIGYLLSPLRPEGFFRSIENVWPELVVPRLKNCCRGTCETDELIRLLYMEICGCHDHLSQIYLDQNTINLSKSWSLSSFIALASPGTSCRNNFKHSVSSLSASWAFSILFRQRARWNSARAVSGA